MCEPLLTQARDSVLTEFAYIKPVPLRLTNLAELNSQEEPPDLAPPAAFAN
jgi:hypothetical protein